MDYNFLGFLLVVAFAFLVTAVLASHPRQPFPVRLLMLAVLARVIGSFARYEVLFQFYGGVGDATGYYGSGLRFAERLWRLDLSVFGYDQWFGGFERWWGTRFIENLSGVVVSFVGPSMRAEFLVFSLLGFVGLYCMALAFHRLHPGPPSTDYARLIWLWPSLWFWPSSVGKESVMMLCIGLVTLGHVSRNRRINWVAVAAGILLAFAVRPHVAGILILAAVSAHWLGSWQKFTLRRAAGGVAMIVGAAVLLHYVQTALGLESSVASWLDFYDFSSGQTLQGGGNIGQVPAGPFGPALAVINIWARPFIWEAHNFTALVSALEILLFWSFVWLRRRNVGVAFRSWRHDRLLRFGLAFSFGYTMALGFTFGNLGIIARQRALAFPFVFLPLCALSVATRRRSRRARSAGRRPPIATPALTGAGQAATPRQRGGPQRWQRSPGTRGPSRHGPGGVPGKGHAT